MPAIKTKNDDPAVIGTNHLKNHPPKEKKARVKNSQPPRRKLIWKKNERTIVKEMVNGRSIRMNDFSAVKGWIFMIYKGLRGNTAS